MTKDIKQIQEENRKLIIKACNPKFDPERFNYSAYQVTLSRVFIALRERGLFVDVGLSDYSSKSQYKDKLGMLVTLYGDDFKEFYWELSKETLEEQSEGTQRAIWELLTENE